MIAGIDVAAERHMLARLDDAGATIGKPLAITEDRDGYEVLLKALGAPPALVVIKVRGHYWKNLFAVLTAAGHEVALWMPVLGAVRRTPWLKAFYERLIAAQGDISTLR